MSELFDPPPASDAPEETSLEATPRRRQPARLGYALGRIGATLGGREVGKTILLGRRGDDRGVVFLDADLHALRERAHRDGATVNDCLLAAVAAGYRTALTAAREPLPDRLPVSVPLALRRRGPAGNQVGVMLVRLPLATHEPDERLRLIAAQTRTEKAAARDQGTLEFMRGPVGARLMDWVGRRQHLVGGFVTNVRGPGTVPYLAGSRVHPLWPVAVIAADVRLGVAALSVGGRLGCGIHFDAGHVPGDDFARGMRAEFDRLTS